MRHQKIIHRKHMTKLILRMRCKNSHLKSRKTRGNVKPHQHKLNPVSEPNSRTIDNFGSLKAATGITHPFKGK